MQKLWLIIVGGRVWDRKLTRIGANRLAEELINKGLNATVCYAEPIQ